MIRLGFIIPRGLISTVLGTPCSDIHLPCPACLGSLGPGVVSLQGFVPDPQQESALVQPLSSSAPLQGPEHCVPILQDGPWCWEGSWPLSRVGFERCVAALVTGKLFSGAVLSHLFCKYKCDRNLQNKEYALTSEKF